MVFYEGVERRDSSQKKAAQAASQFFKYHIVLYQQILFIKRKQPNLLSDM